MGALCLQKAAHAAAEAAVAHLQQQGLLAPPPGPSSSPAVGSKRSKANEEDEAGEHNWQSSCCSRAPPGNRPLCELSPHKPAVASIASGKHACAVEQWAGFLLADGNWSDSQVASTDLQRVTEAYACRHVLRRAPAAASHGGPACLLPGRPHCCCPHQTLRRLDAQTKGGALLIASCRCPDTLAHSHNT
jgi:hypothetical protein